MPPISKMRKKCKENGQKVNGYKKYGKINNRVENQDQHVAEQAEAAPSKSKLAKRKEGLINVVQTRRQAAITDERERVKQSNRYRTQEATKKAAELREHVKEKAQKRQKLNDDINLKIKQKKLEQTVNIQRETINQLQAIVSASPIVDPEPLTTLNQPILINTDDLAVSQSAPNSPTDSIMFELPRPQSAPPRLDTAAGTRIKSRVRLSHGQYDILRNELANEGIQLPSQSTVRRNENRIYEDHFRNSKIPDFYGIIEKNVLKYDFSKFDNVRVTIGGDGGGDGERSTVKIVAFFNDLELALSVKKLMIIWSGPGKESKTLLQPILSPIDADILRLMQNGIMTKSGWKSVIITYIGDLKYQSISLSIQGGFSVCGCPKCLNKRSEWPTLKSEDITLRTIESIVAHADEVVNNNANPRMNGSVTDYPLLKNIPISHYVPPPVHILISLVNEIIGFIKKTQGDKYSPLKEFLDNSGARLHLPAREYNGNGCRRILSHFRQGNEKRIVYEGYGKDLFEAASNIQSFAVARELSGDEIQEMKAYINLFFNLVKNYGDNANKFFLNKTKIHMLKEHVIPFVETFRSWGRFSEESAESIHHVKNDMDKRIPGKGPKINEKRCLLISIPSESNYATTLPSKFLKSAFCCTKRSYVTMMNIVRRAHNGCAVIDIPRQPALID